MDIVALLSRWIHIASAIFLVGGALFGRLALAPASAGLDGKTRRDLEDRIASRLRGPVRIAILLVLASGLYNFLAKAAYPPGYHMAFGIKMLLALHVFAVSELLGKQGVDAGKRTRWMTGVAASGLAIAAIGAWLRSLQ